MSSAGAGETVRKAGLETHGIIATDSEGNIVTIVEGHSYGRERIEVVIKELQETSS